jgi:hypothetical protein
MTLSQAGSLLAAQGADERRRLRDLLLVVRAAQADPAGFKRVWKALAG